MDTTTAVITIGSVITTQAFELWGLWLCMRWRARREHGRNGYLLDITEKVTEGGQVEFDDQDRSGRWLRVSISRIQGQEDAAS